jgi:hypothetical protein
MRKHVVIVMIAAAWVFSGCIPSLHPFFDEKDLVMEPGLTGEWQEKGSDEPEVWRFEPAEDRSYKLTTTDKENKQGDFTAHLFKLEQHYFLDLVPSDCSYAADQADLVAFAMFPGHLLLRVTQFEPELQIAGFDYEWLQEHLEANPKALAHHKEGDRIVLTAETRALQQFVLKHLNELFEEPGVMIRKASDQAR